MDLPSLLSRVPFIGSAGAMRPERDWFAILTFGTLLLVASLAWNAVLFLRLTSGRALDGSVLSAPSAADTSVAEIRAVFERRAAEEARYKSEYQFIDPSRLGG